MKALPTTAMIEPLSGLGCAGNQMAGLGTTFSADQVVGKSLTAKRTVQLKSGSYDNSPVVATVQAGQPVGMVTIWLSPGPNRSALHWEVNNNGKIYFVRHEVGLFDVGNLVVQGTKSTEDILKEKKEEAQKEADPYTYYFKKLVVPVLITVGVVYGVVQLGKTFIIAKVK